ncbi:cyclin-H [Skeletonema marinoi]|uniref:Cyclin-H n=1 Tax=Skeletonema marinoi TaxID=267567 RepID=A0AAD8Y221_9STRA|nr:cyclin-H [Skeletonema marinoi]
MLYEESSQAFKWQLSSLVELNSLRERANRRARDVLSREDAAPLEVYGFADTRGDRPKPTTDDQVVQLMSEDDLNYGPTKTSKARGSNALLTPSDETLLLSFYCSKIPLLIGPHATLPRCKRDAKVAATASLLFRRFYLSNSVMIHDPKTMLAAAAFLAAKVEDCMLDVRYLEMGTKEMNAPVPLTDILDAEIRLMKGIDFDLLVFSPYKTIVPIVEDLRTFLKSERGKGLVKWKEGEERQLEREDLRPVHDMAMKIVDDVIVSDIPLMYAPGEVGTAALVVANEDVCNNQRKGNDEDGGGVEGDKVESPEIDIVGYVRSRFEDTDESGVVVDTAAIDALVERVSRLAQLIRELREGKHGCGNYNADMNELKGVNKKLKKCRAWGSSDKKDKKKRKRKQAEE